MSQNGKPDFSNVSGSRASDPHATPNFDNVQGGVRSTESAAGGGGGGGSLGEQTYTVAEGDTLSHIAQRVYGKAGQWQAIYAANRDQLDDPDRILPGQVLKLPAM